MRRPAGKPRVPMRLSFVRPPDNRFISVPNKKKAGMKPIQNRFSLVASKIPLPAKIKPSNHFLQFMYIIIAQTIYCDSG